MRARRIYTGPDGRSHFDDIPLDFQLGDEGFEDLPEIKAKTVMLRRSTAAGRAHIAEQFHTAPARTYVVLLQGRIEIEVAHGVKERFGPGDIILGEDLEGEGHVTRGVGDEPRIALFLTLEP